MQLEDMRRHWNLVRLVGLRAMRLVLLMRSHQTEKWHLHWTWAERLVQHRSGHQLDQAELGVAVIAVVVAELAVRVENMGAAVVHMVRIHNRDTDRCLVLMEHQ